MEGLELISFQIISTVGTARSQYIHAIKKAKNFAFEEARSLIQKGEEAFVEGHKIHAQLIQQEASGQQASINLLIVHAEDQLMSAEAFKIIAEEFIDVYTMIYKHQKETA